MRRIWVLVFLMTFFSAMIPAAANPIYLPPQEGDIVREHIESESFMTAGENGWAAGWQSDHRSIYISDPLIPIPNGTEVMVTAIDCLYGTDECWALPLSMRLPWEDEFEEENFTTYNFSLISMDELVPAYDSVDFIEQHEAEILPFDEEFDFCRLLPFAVRSYPNSIIKLITIDESFFPRDKCPEDTEYFRKYRLADRLYIDENGDRWVTFEWDGNFGKGWVNIGPAGE